MNIGVLTLTCKITMEKHGLKPDHHNIGDLMSALIEEGEYVAAQFLGMQLAKRAEMTRSIFINPFFKNVFEGSFQEDIKEFPIPGKTSGMEAIGSLKDEVMSFEEIQIEIYNWTQTNFGDNISKVSGQRLDSIPSLMGMVEELGELHHAVLKRHQGIRGFDDDTKYKEARDDALADLLVYICDFASREGVNLLHVLNTTWKQVVSKRNWKTNPQEGVQS